MKTLLLLALSGLFAASLAADEPKGAKPNIIAILADPPLPRFVFTLAATGATLSICIFSSAEYRNGQTDLFAKRRTLCVNTGALK
jgi:hypothetical protein